MLGHHSQSQRTVRDTRHTSTPFSLLERHENTGRGSTKKKLVTVFANLFFLYPIILVDIQLSSVSRLNANVAVGEPVKIMLLEDAIHEASQITLTAMHAIPFVSNVMFSLFTKEIMRTVFTCHFFANDFS